MPERAKPTADGTFPWVCSGCVEPTFKGPVMIRRAQCGGRRAGGTGRGGNVS